jgi:hypothetical protein
MFPELVLLTARNNLEYIYFGEMKEVFKHRLQETRGILDA